MANQTVRGRSGAVAAAARAAAKRAERAETARNRPPLAEDRVSLAKSRERAAGAGDTGDTAGHSPETTADAKAAKTVKAATADPKTTADTADTGDSRRSGLLRAALAVLVAAGLAATALLGWEFREAEQSRQARTDAVAAARKAAPVILSYDYRHLDRDFATARSHLTGSFLGKYRKTTSTVVAPTAKKYHGVVKATVAEPPSGGAPAVSVVSASPGKAVVLLFVNQVTESTQVSGPRVDLNRVRLTLTRTQEGWKVSAVDAL